MVSVCDTASTRLYSNWCGHTEAQQVLCVVVLACIRGDSAATLHCNITSRMSKACLHKLLQGIWRMYPHELIQVSKHSFLLHGRFILFSEICVRSRSSSLPIS